MLSQRSEHRRLAWKAPGDVFNPRRYEVASIVDDSTARAFVEAHHYSGTYPAAAQRFGLYAGPELVGVAVFSVGTNASTVTNVFGTQLVPWQEAYELGRFVLRDSVPYNAESWFLARCFDNLSRIGVRGIISFSDPYPRRRADGAIAFFGHWGQIYQASNAIYTGRATPRTLRVLPDGTVFSDRAAQKIRQRERGWQSAVAHLVDHGAPQLAGDPGAWLNRALPAVTRKVRHPGNHRYVFPLGRRKPAVLTPEVSRPKHTDLPPALQLGFVL